METVFFDAHGTHYSPPLEVRFVDGITGQAVAWTTPESTITAEWTLKGTGIFTIETDLSEKGPGSLLGDLWEPNGKYLLIADYHGRRLCGIPAYSEIKYTKDRKYIAQLDAVTPWDILTRHVYGPGKEILPKTEFTDETSTPDDQGTVIRLPEMNDVDAIFHIINNCSLDPVTGEKVRALVPVVGTGAVGETVNIFGKFETSAEMVDRLLSASRNRQLRIEFVPLLPGECLEEVCPQWSRSRETFDTVTICAVILPIDTVNLDIDIDPEYAQEFRFASERPMSSHAIVYAEQPAPDPIPEGYVNEFNVTAHKVPSEKYVYPWLWRTEVIETPSPNQNGGYAYTPGPYANFKLIEHTDVTYDCDLSGLLETKKFGMHRKNTTDYYDIGTQLSLYATDRLTAKQIVSEVKVVQAYDRIDITPTTRIPDYWRPYPEFRKI